MTLLASSQQLRARLRLAWRRLRPLLGDGWMPLVALVVSAIVAGLAEAGVLALVAEVAGAMVAQAGRVRANLGSVTLDASLGQALLLSLALAMLRLALQAVVAWLPSRVSAEVQARLRHDLFEAFTRASWPVQSRDRDGDLQELMSNQVSQATNAVLFTASFVSGFSMFTALVISAFVLNVPVALAILLGGGGIMLLLRPLSGLGRRAARDLSQATMDHAAGVNGAVRLAEEMQVFGAAPVQRERLDELIGAARDAFARYQLTGRLSQSLYQGLLFILIVAGLSGLYLTHIGRLATLGAAVLMLVRASTYGQQVQGAYFGLVQMLPYVDRLEAVTARYKASTISRTDHQLPQIKTVSLSRASYAYQPGRPVLQDVSFTVQAGEAVGIVGPSGAGKSTLVQLLLRLREPDDGSFRLNGTSAREFAVESWTRLVAYVPQEPRLLQASVADNIRFFRDLDDAAVRRAAGLAHIDADVLAMPRGYDTVIGQRSEAVSGGQRQRICLARALAAEPEMLILDEPTSALDLRSEAAVGAALAGLHGHMTLFIVAHRLSTLAICDRILVLRDGRVEAFAPAEQLASLSTFFQEAAALTAGSI